MNSSLRKLPSSILSKTVRNPSKLFIPYNCAFSTYAQGRVNKRRPDLGIVSDFEVSHFERIFDHRSEKIKCAFTKPEEVESFNKDYTGRYCGSSRLVVLPTTNDQLAEAVKLCNHWKLGILPQGGNTSLVGSSTPSYDEVIISTRRLNKILSIDPDTGIVVCESGVIPADLELALSSPDYDLAIPLDLGSWDICCLGGNASTNARGIRTLRYPDFRYSIVGLEAVLPNGDILNVLEGSHKDPVGVDLKHCFIGTEGIFGIITKLAIKCPPRSKSTEVALITCDDYASVLEILRMSRQDLAETLSAFEYMDSNALSVVEREMNLRLPMPNNENGPFCMGKRHAIFMEVSSSASNSHNLMSTFIEKIRRLDLCKSSLLSLAKEDMERLWRARKAVIDACKSAGLVYKFDLKISARQLPELVRLFESVFAEERLLISSNGLVLRAPDGLKNEARIKDLIIFGQLPTGNIHVVATVDADEWEIEEEHSSEVQRYAMPSCVKKLESIMCRWLRSHNNGGFLSLSKEYDGRWMRWINRLEADGSEVSAERLFPGRDLQLALKDAWDPKGIMNPYKAWPFTNF